MVTLDQRIQKPNNRKQAPKEQSPKEKAETEDTNKGKQAKKERIYILDVSMIKLLKGWDVSANLKQLQSIYVRPFTGAKVRIMKDCAKPYIRHNNPDHITLHFATNELSSKNDAEIVGKSVVDLAKSLLSENCKVFIFGLILLNEQWDNKSEQVNNNLKEMCSSVNIDYIDHFKKFNQKKHLNNSKLHINGKRSWKLNNIFVGYLFNIFK